MLLERGYAGTPLRRIADAAGVTTSALYWHFSSKSELCASAVAREYQRFSDEVTAALTPGPPAQQLRAYVVTFVRYQIARRRGAMTLGFDALVSSLPDEDRSRIAKIQRPLHDRLREILTAGKHQRLFSYPDENVAAFAITTMCNYVFTWYKPDGRLTVDEVADGYADLAVRLVSGCKSVRPDSPAPTRVVVR